MHKFLKLFLLSFVFLTAQSSAVEIVAPTDPIQPGEYEFIQVTHVTPEQARSFVLEIVPSDKVTSKLTQDVASDDLEIRFRARIPGKYRVSLSQNVWARNIQGSLSDATKAKIDEALLVRLKTLTEELAVKYPYSETFAEITVGGESPKPPPDDPDKPPPYDPNKVTQVTYVYEKDRNNIPGPVALGLTKLNAGGVILATEFEEDTKTGAGTVPKQYAIALEAATKAGLPALVFQAGNVVTKVIKDPKLESDVVKMERVKK